jgi:hypothetical protein
MTVLVTHDPNRSLALNNRDRRNAFHSGEMTCAAAIAGGPGRRSIDANPILGGLHHHYVRILIYDMDSYPALELTVIHAAERGAPKGWRTR